MNSIVICSENNKLYLPPPRFLPEILSYFVDDRPSNTIEPLNVKDKILG